MKHKTKERAPKAAKPPVAPAFNSDADEAAFWRTHSVLDYEHVDVSDHEGINPVRAPVRAPIRQAPQRR